ncbi:stage V sporulation protein AB [Bacillus sp. T33-2]|uniref:stage V sporulation protein AB n=1 Tax=Bacillus sp. T33-2 TaxID=2054168 RepID=UPI000C77E9DB|nr:stage V sporulation protein AB [Bacillus sp. T33-2]PLR99807.1 stage V sporulation protein AB [Bacillus sp. T33-2]
MIIKTLFVVIVGLAGGLAVGSGFVAFLTVLGLIPRLTQLSKTYCFIRWYECSVVLGALCGTAGSIRDPVLHASSLWLVPAGLAGGVFVGMLAAALTEVLNVLPILAKRVGVQDRMVILLMAIVLGKVFGSLFHWICYVNR